MSGTRKRGNVDEQWTHAAWELARDLGAREGHVIQISMTPDKRKGVWRIEARLCQSVDGKPVGVARRAKGEYPSVTAAQLSARLYGLLLQLDKDEDLPLLEAAARP